MASHEERNSARSPVFWKELHEFAVICLCGWIIAFLVLPPRLEKRRLVGQMESELEATVSALQVRKEQYEAAMLAMEEDPFFRDEVYRAVLGVKKKGEEFLQKPGPRFR